MQFRHWMENEAEDIQSWLSGSLIQQPVYHGTNKAFKSFEYQKSTRFVLFSAIDVKTHGFFFTEDRDVAKQYGKNIITAYVRMTNPLLDPRRDKNLGVDSLPDRKVKELAFICRHFAIRHPTYGKMGDLGTHTFPIPRKEYDWVYNLIGKDGLHWDAIDNPQIISSMKRFGYDGTFVQGDGRFPGREIFIPDASQIKVVDNP